MSRPAKFSGKRLREARRALKLSRFRLAVTLGVTPQTIVNWEMGTHVPNAEYLVQMSIELGKEVAYFFDEGVRK